MIDCPTEKQLAYWKSLKGKRNPNLPLIIKGQRISPTTEFKKDNIPWNKGKKTGQVPWNKGLEKENLPEGMFSKERNMKISKSLLGNKRRENLPSWNKGLTKEQMPDSMFSAETQAKKSVSCRAGNLRYISDNPDCYKRRKTWKGGISRLPYAFEFDEKCKQIIKKRDGYICQLCGISEKEYSDKIVVHHMDYNKINCADSNLITLCNSCNGKVNFGRDYWHNYFKTIMNEKLQKVTVT